MTIDLWSAVRLSLVVALLAVFLALGPAIAMGYLLARRRFPGRVLVELLVNLPLFLPPVVIGYLLLLLLGRQGPVGRWLEWAGLRVVFSWTGAVIAAAVVSFPLMVRACRIAFAAVDPRLPFVARTLGASRLRAFLTITLPLAGRGVLAGAVLGYARALSEFGATILLAGNIPGQTQTIPLAIYAATHQVDGEGVAWRLVVIAIGLAAGALILADWLDARQERHAPV
jgi:molybdate transport system permease protein